MALYNFARLKPEYAALWAGMIVMPSAQAEAKREAQKIIDGKARYQAVERTSGVPWFVVGCMFMREANGDFTRWMHNGDHMRNDAGQPIRTVHVTANRPPNPNCTWEDGAYDALVTCEHFNEIHDWGPENAAYTFEGMNGFGYRNPSRNIPSPYLWGGTNRQKRGKFVADNVYDASEWDTQIGAMAVMKMVMDMDPSAKFPAPSGVPVIVGAPTPAPAAPGDAPLSPKADDTESNVKPLTKSKTMLGNVIGYLTSVGGAFFGLFDKLDNPYTLTAFLVIVVIASIAAYLIFKGRIDVNNIVKHLSEDDTTPTQIPNPNSPA